MFWPSYSRMAHSDTYRNVMMVKSESERAVCESNVGWGGLDKYACSVRVEEEVVSPHNPNAKNGAKT